MPTIEVSDETYARIKTQLRDEELGFDIEDLDDMIGTCWFFRTVTYHLVGRIKRRVANFFVLEDASWVALGGRLTQLVRNGALEEVEPVGDALVNINAITDAFPWVHPLPKEQQ